MVVQTNSNYKEKKACCCISEMAPAINAAIAGIYFLVYSVCLTEDYFEEIKGIDYIRSVIGKKGSARKAFDSFVNIYVSSGSKESVRKFVDYDTIASRIGDNNFISLDYHGVSYPYLRTMLIPVKNPAGELTHVIFTIQDVADEVIRELKGNDAISALAVVAKTYKFAYVIDIVNHTYSEYVTPESVKPFLPKEGNTDNLFNLLIEKTVSTPYKNEIRKLAQLDSIDEYFVDRDIYTLDFLSKEGVWLRLTVIPMNHDINGKITKSFVTTQVIDKEKKYEQERLIAVNAISQVYVFSICADLLKNSFTPMNMRQECVIHLETIDSVEEGFVDFCNKHISPQYRKQFSEFTDMSTLDVRVGNMQNIYFEYLNINNAWCRASLIPLERDGNYKIVKFFFGITSIDEQKRSDIIRQQQLEATTLELAHSENILQSMSGAYRTALYFNLDQNSWYELDSKHQPRQIQCQKDLPLNQFIKYWIAVNIKEEQTDCAAEFLNISLRQNRFWKTPIMTSDFETVYSGWERCYLIAVDQTDSHTHGCLFLTTDITEQKMIEIREEEMEIAVKAAHEASKIKSDFFADLSHEIRTPLNAVISLANVIAQADTKEECDQYVRIMAQSSSLLLTIINDILDLSKIESGCMKFNPKKFNISDFFMAEYESFKNENRSDRTVDLISPEGGFCVFLDKNRLAQVVNNLMSNAVKYTPKGSILLKYDYYNGKLRFSVIDTGIGISQENMNKLFNRFRKFDRVAQGTGLGLQITKALVEAMGGTINVTSTESVGSAFDVEIPCERLI